MRRCFEVDVLVDFDEVGARLDVVLARRFTQFSRAMWQEAISAGDVLLNGKKVQSKTKVALEDYISGALFFSEKLEDAPEDLDLDVVFCDDAVIVVNKPAGLVVHPAVGNSSGTLLNALLYHFPKTRLLPRAGIVHRLDKDTSGLLVVAHSLEAHAHLSAQLKARTMGREYLALVYGRFSAGGFFDAPIGRSAQDRLKMAVRPDGREARTHFSIEAHYGDLSLVRVRLETGRTHQIRVHFAHHRHPLVGDCVYGAGRRPNKALGEEAFSMVRDFPRQALHAERLRFIHPLSLEEKAFTAPLPSDFQALLSCLERGQKDGQR